MRKQTAPKPPEDVNAIMSRVPPVCELSPHLWLTVYQSGHEQTMRDIVSFADLLAHESLRIKCPLYLILQRNLATLGEIDAWWREISGYQKQMADHLDKFEVIHAPYTDQRASWKLWQSATPVLPERNDVQIMINFLLDVLQDLRVLHAQSFQAHTQTQAEMQVKARIQAAASVSSNQSDGGDESLTRLSQAGRTEQ